MRHIGRIGILTFLAASATWAIAFDLAPESTAAPIPKDTGDAGLIAGKWRAEKTFMNGKEVTGPLADNVFAFDDKGTMTWTLRGNRTVEYAFKLDPKQSPKTLSQKLKSNQAEFRCLYELEGDRLKLAIVKRDADVPKVIDGANPDLTLYELRRFPPEKDPDQKRTKHLGMQFVKIPAGEFRMGITENDAARLIQRRLVDWPLGDWEKQVHKVKLTNDYFIGRHEVTVGQFRKFVEATKYETNAEDGFNAVRTTVIEGAITAGTWRDPQFKQGEDHPVVCVTSVDAQRFIDWLNKTDRRKPEGWEYRLPTEAEWEYAARGSKGTRYPWGNEWKEGCSRPAPEGLCFNLFQPEFRELRTLPVGSFSPKGDSPFGVCDMSGNVSEWCLDWYEDNFPKKDQVDPLGPVPGTISRNGIYASPCTSDEESDLRIQQTMRSRVFKGDSWYDEQRFMSIAQRRDHAYGQRSYIGFRVALAPIVADRKWPAPRAVTPTPGENVLAPTKSSRERMAAFKADAEVTEQLHKEIVAADQMGILVSLEKKPERALHKYYALMEDLAHRCKLSQQSDVEQRPPTVGELGLLLLAGSDSRMPKPHSVENGVLTIKGCLEIVIEEAKPRRMLLRQLLKSWLLVRLPGQRDFTLIAGLYQLKELAPEFSALAAAPDTKAPIRFDALSVLINLGGEPELESLAPLFENEELVPESLFRRAPGWVENRVPQQWRDLALLVMIRIARGETEEYGFGRAKDDSMPGRYDMDLAFLNESARKTAFKKWQSRAKKVNPPAPKTEEPGQQAEPKKDKMAPPLVKPQKEVGKLPKVPGMAPVFGMVTKVDKAAETFNPPAHDVRRPQNPRTDNSEPRW